MSVIGDKVPAPEMGFRRYESDSPSVVKKGTWGVEKGSYNSKGLAMYSDKTGNSAEFKFYGTKFYIIGGNYPGRITKCSVYVDGVYSGNINQDSAALATVLSFKKDNLPLGLHSVEIKLEESRVFMFDAIDIDEDGHLLHSILQRNEDINKIKIGEYISCDYSHDKGFTNLTKGQDLAFICVEASTRRFTFVSDTVFPNISFDELNQKGFIYGNEINSEAFDETHELNIRSLTGGELNGTKSEYDKYIVKNNLDGLINPGDKNIWFWSFATITSSVPFDSNSKIVTRGGTALDTHTITVDVTTKSSTYGFRPVLVINIRRKLPSFNLEPTCSLDGDVTLNLTDIVIGGRHTTHEQFTVNISNSTDVLFTSNYNVIDGESIGVTVNIPISSLDNHKRNKLAVSIIDCDGLVKRKYVQVFRVDNKAVIFDNIYNSNLIYNKNKRNKAIVKINYEKEYTTLLSIDNITYKIMKKEEFIMVNKNDIYIKILTIGDSNINSFGVAFVDNLIN